MNRLATRRHHQLERRTLLKGAFGVAIALPWLEVFQRSAVAQQTDPLRLQIFIHGNGVHPPEWFPDTVGPDYEIKNSLLPLAPFKSRMLVLGDIGSKSAREDQKNGRSGHTIAGAHLLTCSNTVGGKNGQFDGVGYADSISFDQDLANLIGKDLPIKSINTGYHCAEAASGQMPRSRFSYTGPDQPVTPEHRPQQVFDQLVGFAKPAANDPAAQANAERIRARRKSVFDFVDAELKGTSATLGLEDRARLEEYATHLREVETGVANQVVASCEDLTPPGMVNVIDDSNMPLVAEQMFKMTQYAMQCDLTRVGVFQVRGEQSYADYGKIKDPITAGAGGNHHGISHHPNEQIGAICKMHSKFLADHAARLDAVKEGSGTMLDNTIILYTGAIENGGQHNFNNLPHVLIGGTKVLKGGQSLKFGEGVQSNNDLFITLFQAFGVDKQTFGRPDFVTGVLPGVLA
ncbi:MAG: hypothetical protein RJA70_3225 [Pseudomonadota bacterium]